MSESELVSRPFLTGTDGAAARPWPDDGRAAADGWDGGAGAGLVSLAHLTAAIRRSALLCCIMTIVGLAAGCGLYVALPAPYQASTSVVLTDGPYETGLPSATDDKAFAQTPAVAAAAMHELGLSQSISSFLTDYAVTVASARVLIVTFSAPTAGQAVRGANAVAAQLLRFRARLLVQQQQQVLAALSQQVDQARQKVRSITLQVGRASAQPASPAQSLRLHNLRAERRTATASLASLQQTFAGDVATVEPATAAAVKGSRALYAAVPLPRSQLKRILLYPVAGLAGGLAFGLVIVSIRAMVSDRLRRRDAVAHALGAPVRLSTGPLRPGRLSPASLTPRRRSARRADIARAAAHLGRVVPELADGMATLAVVAVDDPRAAALPLVFLATSCAQQGKHVVVADLAPGAPAARMLGSRRPGIKAVGSEGARITVAIPGHDDLAPSGPLGRRTAWGQPSPFTHAVGAACADADLLLTLVTLDPSAGGEHLPTWATDAVVVVTAGRSTWTRVNAVAELVRLSGTRIVSAVLLAADRTDESLGALPRHEPDHHDQVVLTALRPEGSGPVLRTEGAGRHGWMADGLPSA